VQSLILRESCEMRAAAFETILPNAPIAALPLTLSQTPSRSSPLLLLALALPAALAVLAPYSLIAAYATFDSSLLMERGSATLHAGLALILWTLVFCWPILRRTHRMATRRDITIDDGMVKVHDAGLFGNNSWVQPLSAYRGIAHHVRSSLSGTRHELLLIHPDPSQSLLLRAADKIGQSEIDTLGNLLGCREIAPQVFYRNTERVPHRAFRRIPAGLASAGL
jgi:hypothetical protein